MAAANLPSPAPIDTLPDSLLAKIFADLPLKDRYLSCVVSPKWVAASRIPWTDITSFNLSSVPPAMANPILDLCPMIQKILTRRQTIILNADERTSTNANVRAIFLREVVFQSPAVGSAESVTNYFRPYTELADLALINARFTSPNGNTPGRLPLVFPPTTAMSLRRLALINSHGLAQVISAALRETRNLECLIFVENQQQLDYCVFGLPELRELCVVSEENRTLPAIANGVACGRFPKLEVLIYASRFHVDPESIGQLITAELPLRILAIAGQDDPLAVSHRLQQTLQIVNPGAGNVYQQAIVPARPDFSSLSQLRFPPLQIFVGGDFTSLVRFSLPPANPNVVQFWPIDRPMPQFLAQPNVAAIFRDVWVAQVIRNGAISGVLAWGSPNERAKFYTAGGQLLFR